MTNKKQPSESGEALSRLSKGQKSSWSENARERDSNRSWLRTSQRIAVHVLVALEIKQMSQKSLAELMEVSPQYISKLLKGSENLSLETISKLEAALDTRLIDVLDYGGTVYLKPDKSAVRTSGS
jgi:ribosome-binding protein aMBF1 (putative translation factor)